ncbi:MAG: NAD(P)/FAD-dependent oxidoreductase [Panacagrimonas sp.]
MSQLTASSSVVIVGAGQAAGETASELRKLGYEGRIRIFGEEAQPPYKRPPLSKAYLAGAVQDEALFVMRGPQMEKFNIEFVGNARVSAIDRAAKTISLENGASESYDKLVLATGGRARLLPIENADAPNVFPLRTIADVQAIRPHCVEGKRLVIVGGGFIGLEVAAIALKLGLKVTVLEGLPRVLARVTVPQMSSFFERVHRQAGVDLRTGAQVSAFEGNPVTAVTLADGSRIEADFIVLGIGLTANVELAQACGLDVDNGIVVDEFTRTSDPDIHAAGDCTNHPSEFLGKRVRLESVQNAMEQGRAVARNLMGRDAPYKTVPWFWSDQYDLKLQMVGVSGEHDDMVIRGNPEAERSFAVFYLKQGRLIAADAVSRPQEFMFAKKLVSQGSVVDPARLADESLSMKEIASL